jgi:hypothetical protein
MEDGQHYEQPQPGTHGPAEVTAQGRFFEIAKDIHQNWLATAFCRSCCSSEQRQSTCKVKCPRLCRKIKVDESFYVFHHPQRQVHRQ